MHYLSRHTILSLITCFGLSACQEPVDPQYQTWLEYGGGPDQSKYVVLDQIDKSNVDQLEIAWIYPTADENFYHFNPIVAHGVMYVLAKNHSLVALDAATGKELWIHANLDGITRRGVNYWESEDGKDRRILFTMKNTLQALDANTGKSILSFGNNGIVDLREGLGRDLASVFRAQSSTPGRIFEDLILLGSSTGENYVSTPGHLRAYNVITGELVWIFHTIPQPGEFGYDTWPKDAYKYAGGVNCWGEISLDKERGIAYFPLGSPTYDYYGADRIGSNLFGNCILALDARTGKRLWHFQTVHHDLWDYDLTAAPQLITVNHQGKRVDAVAVATKQGFMFVFDRVTGEPLWPIEERPVPESDMPGEQAWPTQPFPTVVPPFTRQIMTKDDVTTFFLSPEERPGWIERVARARKGLYTPVSTEETIAMPGAVGGANWGNTASNPGKGLVYVMSQAYPSFYKLELVTPSPTQDDRKANLNDPVAMAQGRSLYDQYCQICHGKDRAGSSLGPSLLGMGVRLNFDYLQQITANGIGRMPALVHPLENEEINHILVFLNGADSGDEADSEAQLPEGPVVASGGAPTEQQTQPRGRFWSIEVDYPEGVDVPPVRYRTGYGLGYPYIMNPPWSSITAYDLNLGTIKWTKPLGEEPQAVKEGGRNTGVPTGSQRNGIIVTSTGIVFSTVTNGKIYAFDADNGELLWTGKAPLGIASIPTVYEVDGRIFIAFNATTPLVNGWHAQKKDPEPKKPDQGGYVVFSLPENAGR
jgi:quinoprotein glucose dehydrogenase